MTDKKENRNESWDVGWSDNNHLLREVGKMFTHPRTLQPVQRINHIPNNKQLYRKDLLATNMNALARLGPREYDFSPGSWRMPNERQEMKASLQAERAHRAQTSSQSALPTYIVKPALGLQGHGIELSHNPDTCAMVTGAVKGVVQRYIDRCALLPPPRALAGLV
eukprot:COSAG05_NODE_2041_length_3650_cov_10.234582_3_plen_165_part_00